MRVSEIFLSVQGEGLRMGEIQIFVRLHGCNMACKWCDTKYSWSAEPYIEMSPERIYIEIAKFNCKTVCITGGEPLIQRDELIRLLVLLNKYNYEIHLFTNGSIFDWEVFRHCTFISMDMKAPSSGMESDLEVLKTMHRYNAELSFEIKVVVADKTDLEFALEIYRNFDGVLILQPEGGGLEKTAWLVEELKDKGYEHIRILPQLQKLLYGPKRRGI